jgi:hypothetical protein
MSRPKDVQPHKDKEHLAHCVVEPLMHGAVGDSDDSQRLAQQKRYDGDNELLFRMFVEQVPGNGPNKSLRSGRHKGPHHGHDD